MGRITFGNSPEIDPFFKNFESKNDPGVRDISMDFKKDLEPSKETGVLIPSFKSDEFTKAIVVKEGEILKDGEGNEDFSNHTRHRFTG
ncbi:unnamed protein product, partial [Allacma fusca]